jgi:hypothetical protein
LKVAGIDTHRTEFAMPEWAGLVRPVRVTRDSGDELRAIISELHAWIDEATIETMPGYGARVIHGERVEAAKADKAFRRFLKLITRKGS